MVDPVIAALTGIAFVTTMIDWEKLLLTFKASTGVTLTRPESAFRRVQNV